MRLPVHTEVCRERALGAPRMLVGVHVSVEGSYRAPVFWYAFGPYPPHRITRLPVQTAEWFLRMRGALTVDVGVQVSVAGS
jgi:hypothetical protein